jgi:hypothetical protein
VNIWISYVQDVEDKIDTYRDNMYIAVAAYVQSGANFSPETTAGRTFGLVFGWSVLILGITYTANLANILLGTSSRETALDVNTAARYR